MKHVFLGRFAPFHKGHLILLNKLIKKFGLKNCIVMIGSSNVINERTPFTAINRAKSIKSIYPDIKIIYLKDIGDDEKWLQSIKKIENQLNESFTFYGGSKKDLEILSKKFKTKILVNRFTEGEGISATKIRETLSVRDWT